MSSLEEKGLIPAEKMMRDTMRLGFYALSVALYAFALIEVVVAAIVYDGAYSKDVVGDIDSLRYVAEAPRHWAAMIILMTSGALAVFCSVLGACGVVKSNKNALKLCTLLTFANFVLQIAGLGFAFQTAFFSSTLSKIRSLEFFYNTDEDSKALMDTLQRTFSCCGVNGAAEWLPHIPLSCCDESVECCNLQIAFDRGCWPVIGWYTKELTLVAAELASVIAVLQVNQSADVSVNCTHA
ncbi:Hypothetical predicted protein [Cloeon dipterum]|uniref:Tetraspanin n=1 Tax=Cloeon dipterum TaxID=197152 RepID=A0A8S1DU91_9INSE|nr:Hypothetical predicted protein [Cloeon dipterum]